MNRSACCLTAVLSLALVSACSTSKGGNAKAPQGAKVGLTAADMTPRIERVLVADGGTVAMVTRKGCIAMVVAANDAAGGPDELHVKCPKQERLSNWFTGFEQAASSVAFERAPESDDDDDIVMPSAEVMTTSGATLRATKPADIKRLATEVRALTSELSKGDVPAPGPATPAGWQMLHVTGPAHVVFAGMASRGVLEARVSTTGQYFCEYVANTDEGPMRATKSGWLSPSTASHAIDQVLEPFAATAPTETSRVTYAAGTSGGAEKRSNESSTAAVFELFAPVQDALGDACLPELESPMKEPTGL